jgi:hypothetical protein
VADPPAWLLADGCVVLEQRGAVQALLAVEAVLRSDRRNGRAPGPDDPGVAQATLDQIASRQ